MAVMRKLSHTKRTSVQTGLLPSIFSGAKLLQATLQLSGVVSPEVQVEPEKDMGSTACVDTLDTFIKPTHELY